MESIIETLAEYFSPKFKEKLKRCENLEKLLKKLTKKERSLEKKLAIEHNDAERETLKLKLSVLKIQKEKAETLLIESQ